MSRPCFIGGPWDGRILDEEFEPGHPLHGTLPSGVNVPTNPPPAPPGDMHAYEFEGGDYLYRGVIET